MKKFFWGFVVGAVIAFLLGMNVGKGKPLLSNPFAEKPLTEQAKDLGKNAIEQGKQAAGDLEKKTGEAADKVKETASQLTDKARNAIHEATKPDKSSGESK